MKYACSSGCASQKAFAFSSPITMNAVAYASALVQSLAMTVAERMLWLGKGGIYLIRKFFGIILLAIAARLFTANITNLIDQFQGVC